MIEVAIMIEGQNDLNWPRWKRMVQAAEELGFVGLYRSDHFTNANPPDKDSLEMWVSLTWLAANTQRIEFGPLVTPMSFRHPTITARMAAAVDDLSAGRLHLGLGAGWQEREHSLFGHDLLDVPARFARFEEGVQVVTLLLQSDEPIEYQGQYYTLRGATLLPRPLRPGGPPILIGGNGPRRSLPMAARYAEEWNGVYLTPRQIAELNSRLDELLTAEGRRPEDLRRSMMTGPVFGLNQDDLARKMARYNRSADELRERGMVVGTANEVVEQLGQIAEAGLYRVMLQWLDLDDMEGLEAFARDVLPQVHAS